MSGNPAVNERYLELVAAESGVDAATVTRVLDATVPAIQRLYDELRDAAARKESSGDAGRA
jgi:hypothetical protein